MNFFTLKESIVTVASVCNEDQQSYIGLMGSFFRPSIASTRLVW